jgi:2-polyprenyl-3-methyl-5-hydroxy-6-metoxy-1,4-benzoquinol methylase
MEPVAPADAQPELLDSEQVADYWDRRHRAYADFGSGGDVSMDESTNELFYAVRLGRLLDIVGDGADARARLAMLDGGCGKGYFSRAMATFGHLVDGIDVSAHAIESCRSRSVGGDRYAVSGLADWRPPYLYDVVFSVDVLFHVMNDDEWAASVRNLASLVRWGGQLVLADHIRDEDRVWGKYQRTRGTGRYHDLVSPLGFRVDPVVPYRFRHTPVGFHVFTRVA